MSILIAISAPFLLPLILLLALHQCGAVEGWQSHCSPGPAPAPGPYGPYPVPVDVDCYHPVGRIQRCFCDREVPIYKRCVKETLDELDPETANSTIVYEISVILERVSAWDHLEPEVQQYVWQLYDKVLLIRQPTFVASNDHGMDSTQRYLTSLDRFLQKSPVFSFLNGQNLGLMKKPKPECGGRSDGTLGIGDLGSEFGDLTAGRGKSQEAVVSIEVPIEAVCGCVEEVKGIHFVIYRKGHFFLGNSSHPSNARVGGRDQSDRQTRCQSSLFSNTDGANGEEEGRVMSATIQRKNQKGGRGGGCKEPSGAKPVAARIRYQNPLPPLHGEYLVSWWQIGLMEWATNASDLCTITRDGPVVEAECPHLTDFTLLVNGLETDPALCNGLLNAFGYVLNMGSFLALLLLNAIYIVYKFPRAYEAIFVDFLANRLPKIQLDIRTLFYTFTLMLFYLSFGIFSDERHTGNGGGFCRAVAIFNYWLLMACIFLTIFQAWRILKMFLTSVALERWVILATRRQVMLGVSFGVPALLCLIFALSVDNFFYRNDEFCWIRPSYVWFSVVIPLTLLVLNALICSAIICFRLFPNSCGLEKIWERHASATLRISKGVRKRSQSKIAVLLLMQFSLGMPWILQFATLSVPHVTLAHYLFTLVNGSQGLVLLCLFGYKQIHTWRSVRTKDQQQQQKSTEPAGEGTEVFTNSIGMRIPVTKSPPSSRMKFEEKEEEDGKKKEADEKKKEKDEKKKGGKAKY